MQFSLLELTMNSTCNSMHITHLTELLLLHYLVKVETVKMSYYSGILPKKIASNVSYMLHRNGPGDYKMWGVIQQCVYRTKICDIYYPQKCLTQTWVD